MAQERVQRRLAAILSADVAGYSRLIGIDEIGTLSRLNTLRRELIDPAIAAHSGRIVKLMGDGALVEFASVLNAVSCAIEIQRQLRERHASGESDPIRFRIGINVGDIIIEGEDILGEAPRPMSAPPDKPSIAVLAFNNMSGDPEQEYFSDGISEDIITDLSKLSELHVIARNSTFTYKGKAVDVKQIGRELGVRYVLEGSVRKAANRVRVTGQLVDATSGAHIWADRFDRDLTDIFAVQDGLALEIISALKVKLTPEKRDRLSRKGTIDEEANDLFLRGREQAWLTTKSSNVEARNLLERAITISPGFAAAHALIAYTHAVDYANGWGENPERSLQTSLEIARRAVHLNDEDPEAHIDFAVALAWHREHDRALAEARRSIGLAPNFARGHLILGRILTMSGDAAAAIDAIDVCMRFDPLYRDITLHYLAEARVSLGQFDAAVAALKQRLERNPNAQTSLALLANCYGHLGRTAEARAAWAEVIRIAPNFSIEWQRRVLPYKNPSDFERCRVEGLRKANISA
jgi:adenylate cyclase